MKRLRFSLRGLLLVTVAIAGLCWYRDMPRQNADRFIDLIKAGDYQAADAMVVNRDADSKLPFILGQKRAAKFSQSPWDWLRGRYPLRVWGDRGNGQTYLMKAEAIASGVVIDGEWIYLVGRPLQQ
jgi:hypothetical protein